MRITRLKPPSSRKLIGIDDTLLMVLGIPALALLVSALFFGETLKAGWACYAQNLLAANLSTLVYWLGSRQIVIVFRKRFPAPSDTWKKTAWTYSAIALFLIAATLAFHLLNSIAPAEGPNVYRDSSFPRKLAAVSFATIAIAAIYEAVFYLSRWKESLQAAERLRKEHTISQLEALQSQVNPHFLFNSLNTLASLIPEDATRAVIFVQKLSLVYRNILELRETMAHPLSVELEGLENYLHLVRERFPESLEVHVAVSPEARSRYIVPLALQILVENAIKHNIASRKRPLRIDLKSEGKEKIVISNSLQIRPGMPEGTGTGLRNINERFRLTFGTEIEVTSGAALFTVRLPLHEIDEP